MPKKKIIPQQNDDILPGVTPIVEEEEDEVVAGDVDPDVIDAALAAEEDHEFDEEELYGEEKDAW